MCADFRSEVAIKRFTESTKWRDPWFWSLSYQAKLLWIYIFDLCDAAGIVDLSLGLASGDTGTKITDKHLAELSDRLVQISKGKFFIRGFIQFQYGKLSRDCKPHAPVFASLHRHGIPPESIEQNTNYGRGLGTELRRRIIKRDDSCCVYTGKRLFDWEIEIDHIVPVSKGGTNEPENLVVMDASLNAAKSDFSVQEFCSKSGLSYEDVRQRLSKATKVGLPSLQEKEKDKDKEQVQEKEGDRGSGKGGYHEHARVALHFLNEKSGRHFRETDENLRVLSARLSEPEVNIQGVKQMIERQCKRWLGTDQSEYLRPETLFGKTKFESYYAAKDVPLALNGAPPPPPPRKVLNLPTL